MRRSERAGVAGPLGGDVRARKVNGAVKLFDLREAGVVCVVKVFEPTVIVLRRSRPRLIRVGSNLEKRCQEPLLSCLCLETVPDTFVSSNEMSQIVVFLMIVLRYSRLMQRDF
jgi:hypothetical protein